MVEKGEKKDAIVRVVKDEKGRGRLIKNRSRNERERKEQLRVLLTPRG